MHGLHLQEEWVSRSKPAPPLGCMALKTRGLCGVSHRLELLGNQVFIHQFGDQHRCRTETRAPTTPASSAPSSKATMMARPGRSTLDFMIRGVRKEFSSHR